MTDPHLPTDLPADLPRDGALLTDLMHREVDHLAVPTDLILADVRREGRSRLRRRRAVQGLGVAAAAVALIAGVAVLRPDADPVPRPGSTPVASDPAASAPATGTPSPAGEDGGQVVVRSDQQTARILARLLPGPGTALFPLQGRPEDADLGLVRTLPDGTTGLVPIPESPEIPYGSLVWDDGQGRAEVSVIVEAPDPNAPGATLEDVRELCGVARCADVEGGGFVAVLEAQQEQGGIVTTLAHYVAPDGTTITVTALNAPLEKDAVPTRPLPPFTGDELAAVAMDPVWR
ncbi:hypothetical protein [Nocardioides sp.]|uniref:hypothetical protein n=1 Tax=Nocardioides sp. TaxID=35761 RepID=UPI003511C9BF